MAEHPAVKSPQGMKSPQSILVPQDITPLKSSQPEILHTVSKHTENVEPEISPPKQVEPQVVEPYDIEDTGYSAVALYDYQACKL